MMVITDHTFAYPRDCLGHLMSASVGLCLNPLGVACRSFFYPDPPCHLTNLTRVCGLRMGVRCVGIILHCWSWCTVMLRDDRCVP